MSQTAVLLHLSDLHIGRTREESARAGRIRRWIATHHPGAPVLLTGDLTHSGKAGQCEETRALLEKLADTNPVLAIPGNHDYGLLGIRFDRSAYKNWYKHLADPLGWPKSSRWQWLSDGSERWLGVLHHGRLTYFGLDSCDPDDRELCARGLIKRRLSQLLEQALAKHQGTTRVVMLHHHPFEGSYLTALKGSRRLLRAIASNCELVLFGHHHHCSVWGHEHGIPMIVASHKSTNRMFSGALGVGVIGVDEPGEAPQIDYRVEAVDLDLPLAA